MKKPSVKDNPRYRDLVVKEGVYIPDVGIDYPADDPYARLVESKSIRDLKFDETYPYEDNSFSFKFQRMCAYFLALGPYFLINRIYHGIRFEGRDILRKYKKEFDGGLVAICNHCFRWDGMSVVETLRHGLWIPMFAKHFNSKDYWYMRYVGGIPIPENYGGLKKFNEAFDHIHEKKGWIMVFPEACNWHFYKPIKPFKKGALTMAYKYNIPILPLCVTYRERKGIYRLFGKKEIPLITMKVGEPIFPDMSNNRKDEVDRLIEVSHKALCDLAGIEKNSWPAFWEE